MDKVCQLNHRPLPSVAQLPAPVFKNGSNLHGLGARHVAGRREWCSFANLDRDQNS
jgi:hypothetical protein